MLLVPAPTVTEPPSPELEPDAIDMSPLMPERAVPVRAETAPLARPELLSADATVRVAGFPSASADAPLKAETDPPVDDPPIPPVATSAPPEAEPTPALTDDRPPVPAAEAAPPARRTDPPLPLPEAPADKLVVPPVLLDDEPALNWTAPTAPPELEPVDMRTPPDSRACASSVPNAIPPETNLSEFQRRSKQLHDVVLYLSKES